MQEEMKIDYLDISKIKPYKRNAKKHPQEQINQIVKSIEQFGNNDPIAVWGDQNVIVEGHGRYLALKQMGVTGEIPVIHLDHLTDEERRVYGLVHNKLTMNSDFDFDLLEMEFNDIDPDLFDMADFGFFQDDEQEEKKSAEVTEDDFDESTVTEAICKRGQVWQLGEHRLMCGDSTSSEDVEKLMNGEKANISFTSPPYNADHMDVPCSAERGGGTQKSTQKKYLADNDKRTEDDYFEFLCENMNLLLEQSDEVFYNIGVGSGSKSAIAKLLNHYSDQFKELMYWVKENPMPVIIESVVSSSTELILCFGKNGTRSFNHFKDRMFHGVITGLSAATTNKYADIHKATFPVYLPFAIISRFTPNHGSVLDCFGGTGTTMIACEQLSRRCFMMEIEPRYCDVIIKRWEDFTGKKAELLEE